MPFYKLFHATLQNGAVQRVLPVIPSSLKMGLRAGALALDKSMGSAQRPKHVIKGPSRGFRLNVYSPKTLERGVIFLHVPKTAGSFVNSVFIDRLGPSRCDPFMRNAKAYTKVLGRSHFASDYVSAHLNLQTVLRSKLTTRYGVLMVLRDPLDRLISHLNWMDRFNHGLDRHEFRRLDPAQQTLVRQIGQTDPKDPEALSRLFAFDAFAKALWMFNRQTATLCVKHPSLLASYEALEDLSDQDIRRRLDRCEAVVTLAQFQQACKDAGVPLDAGRRVNPAKTKRFQRSDVLDQAARRFTALDQRLIDLAQNRPSNLERITEILAKATPR